MRAIDLFCGCGGLSCGLERAGVEIIAAFDNWDDALAVYSDNFSHPVIKTTISGDDLSPYMVRNPDLIVGGPPCQDFSSAGKRDESLGRADLTLDFANIIAGVRPKWFIMENVERITKSWRYTRALEIYRTAGYGLTCITLDASFCGVPQARKRHFVIGGLREPEDFLKEILLKDQAKRPMSMRDYFGDELDTEYVFRMPRNYNRRGVFSVDEPYPTVRGVNGPIPPGYSPRPNDATQDFTKVRALTTMERARVQTFPKDFSFDSVKSKTKLEKMIGNAVPVELATYIARHLLEYERNGTNRFPVCTFAEPKQRSLDEYL